MLKKHNKLIMLLVLVTFMFTMVGSAGAASFSDVTGTSVEAQAIYRLNGLGVLDGYPDGTFGPEKTITRAEFAKIACVTAGLKAVASGMGGTASPFSDVATDHWANGWVNVAAAQGFVKGDPAGTFRPEDKITQAEVITVLLRLLGYNDNLPGEWPSDYISKAANLGVLDDVTFVATQAATRGTVAVLAGATLDENVVQYKASDNIFDEALKSYDKNDGNGLKNQSYTLLYDKFNKSQKVADAVLIYDLDLSDGKQAIKVVDPKSTKNDVDTGTFISYTLADGCVISGATSILGVVGRFAEYTLDKDDKVISIEVKNNNDYKVLTGLDPDDIERVNGTTIKLDSGKSYEIAANFDTYSSSYPGVIYTTSGYKAGNFKSLNALLPATFDRPAKSGFLGSDTSAVSFLGGALVTGGDYSAAKKDTLKDYMEGVFLAAESIDLVLDKDGKIAYVNCNAWPTAVNPTLDTVEKVGIVDRVSKNTGKVTLKNSGSFTLDADDPDNQVIIKNGKVVSLTDLAEDDMVWFLNKYNTDVVIAMSITAAGKFDSYESTTFLG
ncbi:MAG: S-layer homology domain-containing protein, partial [Syntrophomonadaceae bacterium]|nr:S-layer homology domain-containing protein [Syntrophomonadaceae bacterium]